MLVVEDAYLVAQDTARLLREAGAAVVGPVGWLDEERELVTCEERLGGAVLDVRPGEEWVAEPLAAELVARGVPVLLTTACGWEGLSEALRALPRLCEPLDDKLGWIAAGAFSVGSERRGEGRSGHRT